VSTNDYDVRVSYRDLWLAWKVLDNAAEQGRGAVRRAARTQRVDPARISRALDRVESAFGGEPFFVMVARRGTKLSAAGKRFLNGAPRMLDAWAELHPQLGLVDAGDRPGD